MTRREAMQSTAAVAAAAAFPSPGQTGAGAHARNGFDRLIMHWYIFGPAWTKEEAERQLRIMADAHIGGVLVFPTYPIAMDDPARGIRNQHYLSREFLEVLAHVASVCRSLSMTMDLVLGTGWPYGGPTVTLDQSAHMIRRAVIPVANGRPARLSAAAEGESVIAAFFVADGVSTRVDPSRPELMAPGPFGRIEVYYSSPTRMQVKRASVGAEGWIVDHYNSAALQNYLRDVGDKLLGSLPEGALRSVFCDSFEVYRTNWTARFPELFQQMRGYDLVPHLPALFDREHPDNRDLRFDFWRTLSETAEQQFVKPLCEWARRRGATAQVESYGTPPVALSSYRHVDIPVGEHYEWKEFNVSRWASSGGHLAGKPVILAEGWTWAGLPNRFGDTLEQLKLVSDLHFLSGINALYGLTYAYSPASEGSPGWVPYFGPAANHNSPWWPYFSHLADYVARTVKFLQAGKPVADVALYLPAEDGMAEAGTDQLLLNWAVRDRLSSSGPPPEFRLSNALRYYSNVVATIITNGYAFDGVDWSVFDRMRVENGRLRQGEGDYGVVILPNLTGIAVTSLETIVRFAEAGGLVIVTRRWPERTYGINGRNEERVRFRQLLGRLQKIARFAPDERGSLRAALRSVRPDVSFAEASADVSFVHRRSAAQDYYFVANTGLETRELSATFRVNRQYAASNDLISGERARIDLSRTPNGASVSFELGPLESRVLEFTDAPGASSREPKRVFDNGPGVSGIPAPYRPKLRWRLRLGDKSFDLDELKSWTELAPVRYFSGRGIYTCELQADDGFLRGHGVMLDLGRVHETAEIWINNEHAGTRWMRPFVVDASRYLRPGVNQLRIEVTNLLINEVLGNGPIDYSEVWAKWGRRFPAGDEWTEIRDPFPSGLFGPVRLVFYRERD